MRYDWDDLANDIDRDHERRREAERIERERQGADRPSVVDGHERW